MTKAIAVSRSGVPDSLPQETGAAAATVDDAERWHLIRMPTPAQLARRRGFPPDRIDLSAMRAWCAGTCRGRWVVQPTTGEGTVYRFERRDDALAFALRWFPFKCG